MNFGEAIKHAQNGKKIARLDWNGQNMYVVLMNGYPNGIPVNEATAKAHNIPVGTKMIVAPYWAIYTPQGGLCNYAVSHTDTLAEDWTVVGGIDKEENTEQKLISLFLDYKNSVMNLFQNDIPFVMKIMELPVDTKLGDLLEFDEKKKEDIIICALDYMVSLMLDTIKPTEDAIATVKHVINKKL